MAVKKAAPGVAWGVRMVFWDNLSRPLEAVLTLVCASLYAGGDWGSFRLAESYAYFLFHLSFLGLDRGIVWWFGQVDGKRYRQDLSACLGRILLCSLVSVGILVLLSHSAIGHVKGLDLPPADQWRIALSIPMLTVAGFLYQANLNQHDLSARILGVNLVIPAIMFGGAALGRVLHWPWSLSHYFLAGNAANLAVAMFSFVRLHGISALMIRSARPSHRLAAYGLPLAGADALSGMVARFDLAVVGNLAGIRAVEVYNLVTSLGKSLTAIRQSFEGLLLSSFSQLDEHRYTLSVQRCFNRAVVSVAQLMGMALLTVVFWGPSFLSLLNPQYREGYPALVALTAFTFLNVAGDLSGVMLQGLGRSRAWGVAQALGFAVNVVCNLWWIPRWGTLGGIMALGAAMLVEGCMCQIFLKLRAEGRIWSARFQVDFLAFSLPLFGACWFSQFLSWPWRLAIYVPYLAIWSWIYHRRFRFRHAFVDSGC